MRKKIFLLFLCLTPLPLVGLTDASEKKIAERIRAHLSIRDVHSACEEGRLGLIQRPNSKVILEAYLPALAKAHDENLLWKTWKSYVRQCPEAMENKELIETFAWEIIANGASSPSPVIRSIGLLGAFFGQDAKGVDILCKMMHDPNSLIRALTVKLSSHLRDARLGREVIRLFHHEKNWMVRLEVIKAFGVMKLKEAHPLLIEVISSTQSSADEKTASAQSLVELFDAVDIQEIRSLAFSDRAGLRLLACKLIEYAELKEGICLLTELLQDHHPEVRLGALHALGVMRISFSQYPIFDVLCKENLIDPNPQIAVMSAWVLALNRSTLFYPVFKKWLECENDDTRLIAAGALAATGKYGTKEMLQAFQEAKDPYVRMNLALGLVKQRVAVDEACQALSDGLKNEDRWMWNEGEYFKVLSKSKIKHNEAILSLPETINQVTRLEILNTLFILKFPQAQNTLNEFLREHFHGIPGLASALLLTEGDDEAIKIVENLLNEKNKKIRIQAALILAIWGKKEEAIAVLEEGYEGADRTTKEQILAGLGNIGASLSIPFLIEKLQEPHQALRIIAAAALVECLNQ